MVNVKILLVEDESIEAIDIKRALESFGYDVPYVASSSQEAVRKAREIMPDLILMDLILKGDGNGIDAVSQIKNLNIPVIYLTAHSEESTVQRAISTEPYAYLLKPFDVNELKFNVELVLCKHEAYKRWENTFNAIEECICFVEPDGTLKQCNSAMERLLKMPCHEFLGKKCWEVIHGTEEPVGKCPVVRMWESKKRESLEIPFGDKWLRITADPIFDDKGELTGSVHILTNITKRKEVENALRESEEKYRALFESDPDYTLLLSLDGKLLDINPAAEQVIGIPKDKLLGKHFIKLEIFSEDEKPLHEKMISRLLEYKDIVRYESRIITGAGEIHWVKTTLNIMVREDLPDHILMIHTDITKRKMTENDLQESLLEEEITSKMVMQLVGVTSTYEIYSIIGKALKELLPDSYIIVTGINPDNQNVRIIEIVGPDNFLSTLTKILGIDPYKMEFAVGEISEEDLIKHRSEVLTEYGGGFYELTLGKIPRTVCTMIEKIFHIESVYSIRFSFEGRHYGGVSIALLEGQSMDHKNTIETIVNQASIALKRSRAEEVIKESLREKEVLLREIHHRVKNNMQIVASLLNLQTHYVNGKETQNVLMESQNRVKSMAMIHEKLYQSQDLTHIQFEDYIQRLVSDLFYSYKVQEDQVKQMIDVESVKLNIETAVPCGLIISELVSNSLKHAFPSGKNGEVCISLKTHENEFILTISDNGVGLPKGVDYKKTQTLGLELVNNLVKQIDGSIKLDKTNGTRFTIRFKELEYKKRV